MDALLIGYAVLASLVFCQVVLLFVNVWEQHRFHSGRHKAPLRRDYTPQVRLVVPCKGLDLELESNLQALFELDYPRLELCFVVENPDEPAVDVIRHLQGKFAGIPCQLIFAGQATRSGQKVHNLIAATREIPVQTEVLAFVDSDARPHSEWLLRLVERLENGKRAVATGYRWMRPTHPTWPNQLLSAINNTIIGLAGPHGFNLVWGGAWAAKVETFRSLGLPERWEGTLSDDLVVARLAHDAGLKVGYEPHCLINSPIDFDAGRLSEFLRRQHLVVRVYAPLWSYCALALGALTNVVLWGSLVLAAIWFAQGNSWRQPAAVAAMLYTLTAYKNFLTVRIFRPFVRVSDSEFQQVARWNCWGWPLVSLANWCGVVAALAGRSIVWRGIRYRLISDRETEVMMPDNPIAAGATARATVKAA